MRLSQERTTLIVLLIPPRMHDRSRALRPDLVRCWQCRRRSGAGALATKRNDCPFAGMEAKGKLRCGILQRNRHRNARANSEIHAVSELAGDNNVVFAGVAGVRVEREEEAMAISFFAQHKFE